MAHIIAISNRKGGVGKTTSVINIGAALARRGYSVLLVDLDPQYNLTRSLKVNAAEGNIYEVLQGGAKPQPVAVTEGLDLLPTTKDLAFTELALASAEDGRTRLRAKLHDLARIYDYILIDTAPGLGLLTINALVAASHVLAPLQAEYLPLQGLADLLDNVDQLRQGLNKELHLAGVLLVRYDNRPIICRKARAELAAYLESYGEGKLFTSYIHNNVAVIEAQAYGLDIYRYDPKSRAAQDYEEATAELLEVIG